MMKKLATLVLTAVLSLSLAAAAEDAGADDDALETRFENTIETLDIAGDVVELGRKDGNPLFLVAAAQIVGKLPLEAVTREKNTEKNDDWEVPSEEKGDAPLSLELDAGALLEQAAAMSEGNEPLLAVIADTKKALADTTREVLDKDEKWVRTMFSVETVAGLETDIFEITCASDEPVVVFAAGDGDSDLDLFIFDKDGEEVTSDEDGTDRCLVRFVPEYTGPHTIKVSNLGGVHNRYVLGVISR